MNLLELSSYPSNISSMNDMNSPSYSSGSKPTHGQLHMSEYSRGTLFYSECHPPTSLPHTYESHSTRRLCKGAVKNIYMDLHS